MTNTKRALALLNYEKYDRLPIVHFGYWGETLKKWHSEGHITAEEWHGWRDGENQAERSINSKLGWDFNWYNCFGPRTFMYPTFESKIVKTFPDGSSHTLNSYGVIELNKPGAGSIHAEIDHTLKDRESWERDYKFRFQFSEDRIPYEALAQIKKTQDDRDIPLGIHAGSLLGNIRNVVGMLGVAYIYADDEELFREIIDTVGSLCYEVTKKTLETGVKFDFGHFWEDICFKNGPLINPSVFDELIGPWYKKITGLMNEHGIKIVSLDCDGLIDSLIPTWINNGVNTMFPIEVGTWNANIAPWREKYGKELRGVGGMNKNVFSQDRAAIDAEIERLKPLIALGGYIPCPDHRIAPDAVWENVQYYCEKLRNLKT